VCKDLRTCGSIASHSDLKRIELTQVTNGEKVAILMSSYFIDIIKNKIHIGATRNENATGDL
jgi:hypothetical protein